MKEKILKEKSKILYKTLKSLTFLFIIYLHKKTHLHTQTCMLPTPDTKMHTHTCILSRNRRDGYMDPSVLTRQARGSEFRFMADISEKAGFHCNPSSSVILGLGCWVGALGLPTSWPIQIGELQVQRQSSRKIEWRATREDNKVGL